MKDYLELVHDMSKKESPKGSETVQINLFKPSCACDCLPGRGENT